MLAGRHHGPDGCMMLTYVRGGKGKSCCQQVIPASRIRGLVPVARFATVLVHFELSDFVTFVLKVGRLFSNFRPI